MSEEVVHNLPNPPQVSNAPNNASGQEDVVSKYKRLLSLARSSLEANQAALSSKDQQIQELMNIIEEERNKRLMRVQKEEDGNQQFPRRILCRVDVVDLIWVLLEFDHQDEWKCFVDEQSLQDYIKRVPGVPLQCPQKCLSVEESTRMIDDCKRRTEKVIEEFRRYKVRMEISIKQRDAESKPIASLVPQTQVFAKSAPSTHLSSNLEKALSLGTVSEENIQTTRNLGNTTPLNEEIQRLKTQLQEQEAKWRHSIEKLAKENDVLKTKGAESVVAAQWRVRYENCLRDKEELSQKLKLYTQLSSEVTGDGRTVEQLYIELHEEYKGIRKRLHELMHHYMTKDNLDNNDLDDFLQEIGRILQFYHIDHRDLDESKLVTPMRPSTPRSRSLSGDNRLGGGSQSNNNGSSSGSSSGGKGMAESKVQYVRQMIFQYLVCREAEVKQHIENALMTLFRFSEEEKEIILSKKNEDNEDTFSSITNFFGSFTS